MSSPTPEPRADTARPRSWLRRLFSWPIRTVGQLLVAGLVVEFLVLPQLAGTRAAVHTFLDPDSPWLALALGAELASLAAFAAGTREMLARSHRPPWQRVLRIDLATIGLNHSVPAGTAAGAALGLRLLGREGVPVGEATFAKIAQGVASSVVLVLLLWSALAVAIPLHGDSPLYLTGSVGGLVLVTVAAVGVGVLRRGRGLTARLFEAVSRRLPFLDDRAGARLATRAAEQLDAIFADPPRLLRASLWAALNWLLDAAALWCSLRAYGLHYGYDALMVPFTLARIAAWVPLTPGGLGIVEGVLIPTLVGFGGARRQVIIGVITYRLFSYWLTLPLGGAAYGSIAGNRLWRRRRRPPALADDDQ